MRGSGSEVVGSHEVPEGGNPDGSVSGNLVCLSAAGDFSVFVSY